MRASPVQSRTSGRKRGGSQIGVVVEGGDEETGEGARSRYAFVRREGEDEDEGGDGDECEASEWGGLSIRRRARSASVFRLCACSRLTRADTHTPQAAAASREAQLCFGARIGGVRFLDFCQKQHPPLVRAWHVFCYVN